MLSPRTRSAQHIHWEFKHIEHFTRWRRRRDKNPKRGKTRNSHHFLVTCSVLDHELFHYVVEASFTASTPNPRSCFTTSFFFDILSSSMSSLTRSAAKHFRVLRRWIYLRFSAMIQHEPLWNLRNAQHVESLLRSFEQPAQQTLNMLRACTVDKSSAFARGFMLAFACVVWKRYTDLGARFSKVPKLYGPFSSVTIPFVSQERRWFKSSNFTVFFLFVSLKTCLKIGFPKQAVGGFTNGFLGPKSFRDFRETGPWPVKALVPDFPRLTKMPDAVVDFDASVEIRFHLA